MYTFFLQITGIKTTDVYKNSIYNIVIIYTFLNGIKIKLIYIIWNILT